MTRSLDREKLQFEDSSGKPAGVATLGHRMKRFKSLLLTEEGELARLWKEWTDAQQAIIDFSKEVLGPNNLADEEQRRTDQIEAERLKFVEEIENMSKGAIEKMVASEKVRNLLFGYISKLIYFLLLGNGHTLEETAEAFSPSIAHRLMCRLGRNRAGEWSQGFCSGEIDNGATPFLVLLVLQAFTSSLALACMAQIHRRRFSAYTAVIKG